MKIAFPVADGKLCAHFGHCQFFALVEVNTEAKSVIKTEMLSPPAHEPGVLPKWLSEQGANLIIAGGMGMRAQQFFQQYNINVVVGVNSMFTPEELALNYINNTLEIGDNICDH
ncbi:MAG: NifB/NifX family molybdenum-iron cluster-binding protein [candidate division Zixibacteria bacterium]|nr:NifB/NifX family molybdenum-iron cluster-binding protein [candidate division Zixibacteria bacterium]